MESTGVLQTPGIDHEEVRRLPGGKLPQLRTPDHLSAPHSGQL